MRGVLVVTLAFGAVISSGCRDPTQITLTLRTNAECSDVAGTAISVGGPNEVEGLAPVATTSSCIPDPEGGDIGSLVLVPANADDAAVGVKVTLSVGDDVESCLAPPFDDCIVARRLLRYIAHTPLTLPVELSLACKGQYCGPETTCVEGRCVDANVDPNDCIDPRGCEPTTSAGGSGGGGGAGGAGGEGGAPPACGLPQTLPGAPIQSLGSSTRGDLALAGDPSTCGWAAAWHEETQACLQRLGPEGQPLTAASCRAVGGPVDDVAVSALGDGAFAVAAWSSELGVGLLWVESHDPGAFVAPIQLAGVRSGALASRGNTLVVVNQGTNDTLVYITYAWTSSLSPDLSGSFGVSGSTPHAVWAGEDLVVSWLSAAGNPEGGQLARLSQGDWSIDNDEAVIVPAVSEIVMASREPSGVVGVHFRQAAKAATLDTWGPAGFTPGNHSATGSATAENFSIAATDTGWVVAFTDFDRAWLTPFDAAAVSLLGQQQLAPSATSLAIAAIGDQLAAGWIDSAGGVHFRLLDANGLADL